MKTKLATLCLLMGLSCSWAFAQKLNLTGTVSGANKAGAYATVKLLKAADSEFATGTLADEEGRFTLDAEAGSYVLQISKIGFGLLTTPAFQLEVNMVYKDSLALTEEVQQLNSVTIVKKKPYVENHIDRVVLNVEQRNGVDGLNTIELLRQAPGLTVDGDDNIRMGGKSGVNVFVNGRALQMSQQDLATFLKSLQANTIASIDLISNPSAKYDAAGNAGIIDIKLKRQPKAGINGSVTGSFLQSDHARYNAGTDLTFNEGRWTLFGNYSFNGGRQFTRSTNNRLFRTTNERNDMVGLDVENWRTYSYKAGGEYRLSSRQVVGFQVMGNGSNDYFDNTNEALLYRQQILQETALTTRYVPHHKTRTNYNLNYRYSDTTGLDYSLDVDLSPYTSVDGNYLMNVLTQTGQPSQRIDRLTNDTNGDIDIFSTKGDLSKMWKQANTKLETGFKTTSVRSVSNLRTTTTMQGEAFMAMNNQFVYNEHISALYANLNRGFGKLNVQAGLRAEYARIKGKSTTNVDLVGTEKPDTSYLNLFPSAFAQYQLGEGKTLSMAYGRRIDRPFYQDLNPFTYQVDFFTQARGNPYILPQYTNNVELSYTYKYASTFKLSYSHTNSLFSQIREQSGTLIYDITRNVGYQRNLTLSFSSPINVTKWWSGYLYVGAFYNYFKGQLPQSTLDVGRFGGTLYWGNTMKLSKKSEFEIGGWYNSPSQETQFRTRSLGSLDMSYKYMMLNNRANLKVGLYDVLNTQRWATELISDSFTIQSYRKWESRRVFLSLTYTFNRGKVQEVNARESGAESERRRIRNKDH
ncbi:outer membrane beta-barrel protein [Fibrella sp. WM1]|uniref:outer membrane beta-barrel protein n=1 Tax=Fibrella musci TaxID=3242485 RepID=UPI0035211FD8